MILLVNTLRKKENKQFCILLLDIFWRTSPLWAFLLFYVSPNCLLPEMVSKLEREKRCQTVYIYLCVLFCSISMWINDKLRVSLQGEKTKSASYTKWWQDHHYALHAYAHLRMGRLIIITIPGPFWGTPWNHVVWGGKKKRTRFYDQPNMYKIFIWPGYSTVLTAYLKFKKSRGPS